MRLSRLCAVVLSASLFSACGKSDAPPAPTPPVATPTPDPTPAPTPPADVAVTPAPEADPTPAPEAVTGPAYIVWIATATGYESSWLVPGEAGYASQATRPQLAIFAGETLWGLEVPTVPYHAFACDDLAAEEDGPKAKPGPIQELEYLALRGLAGADAGEEVPVSAKVTDHFEKEPDAKGIYSIDGESDGRSLRIEGSAGALLLATDCEAAYTCGVHGNVSCVFIQHPLVTDGPTLDLGAALKVLAPTLKTTLKAWAADDDSDVRGAPSIEAVAFRFANGAPLVDYLLVAETSYAASLGDWSSYTQSRTHTGPILPELGLPALPAPVAAWLATQTVPTAYGWSEVPTTADPTIQAAFRDTTTIPKRAAPSTKSK